MADVTEPTAQQYSDVATNSPMADFGFMSKYKAIATQLGHDVGAQVGVDTSDPQNLVQVMHSATYADKLNKIKNGSDDRLVKRVLGSVPPPANTKASGSNQEMAAYSGQEQNVVSNMRAKAVLASKQMAAQSKLNELSDFDTESYKAARLKELNPTSDIDQKMLNLRMQAIIAKSALRSQLRQLDPVLRDQAINARMSVFSDAISTLGEIRDARVKSAEGKIAGEISAKNEQKRTAKANVDALDGVIKTLKDQGNDGDAIYKIRLERAKAQKALDKAGASGVPDQEQNMINYLLDNLTKNGYTPNSSDIANAKRIAKETLARRQVSASSIRSSKKAPNGATRGLMTATGLSEVQAQPLKLPPSAGDLQDTIEQPDGLAP